MECGAYDDNLDGEMIHERVGTAVPVNPRHPVHVQD
jgi:hypothetical protein